MKGPNPAGGRSAFTLVEVIAAVLIMSLVAGAAAYSFQKPLRTSRVRDVEEQIRSFDASARQSARAFGREVQLVFDLTGGTLARHEGERGGRITYRSALSWGYRIATLRTAVRRSSGGEVTIRCSGLGLTPSYALHLVGPGLDRWVLIAGLGGEATVVNDERSLDEIFKAAPTRLPTRDDAD